ncbi:MAG: hypothetical protein K0R85_2783, partial [Devosia sp.]|nr:hypothetical protein [Devosia sp.]
MAQHPDGGIELDAAAGSAIGGFLVLPPLADLEILV